jgi:hypothetical protein
MKDGQNEAARRDFESAAKMGSGFAKAQVIRKYIELNPQVFLDIFQTFQLHTKYKKI